MNKPQKKSEKIQEQRKFSLKKMRDKTDYKKLDALQDDEIDYSDIPEKSQEFWAKATVADPGKKQAISIRLDTDIIEWFKQQDGRYQRLMNQVLRQYMQAHKFS